MAIIRSVPRFVPVFGLVGCNGALFGGMLGGKADPNDPGGGGPGDVAPVEHCGPIEADETWGPAGSVHQITCPVKVRQGVLTIEPGVTVIVDAGKNLRVGSSDTLASIRVLGTAEEPVVFRSPQETDPEGAWGGILLTSRAEGSEIHYLQLVNGGTERVGALNLDEVTVPIEGLQITGSAGCGLKLTGESRIGEGSAGFVLTENLGAPACVTLTALESLPVEGSNYTGNGLDRIEVDGSDLEVSTRLDSLGVPFAFEDRVRVGGAANDPAILTIGPGVELQFAGGKGLIVGSNTAGGLVTEGTSEAPVVFTARDSFTPGAWEGIEVFDGVAVGHLNLAATRIEWAGDNQEAALRVDDTELAFNDLEISGSLSAGLLLEGTAAVAWGSATLNLTANARPMILPPTQLGRFPSDGIELTGNAEDVIQLKGDGEVRESATWPNLGVDYQVSTDIKLEGTASEPTLIAVEPGVTFRFDDNKGFSVSKGGGAAGLDAWGTEAEPIRFLPYGGSRPGAWIGVEIHANAISRETRLANFEIEGAGARGVDGALYIKEATPNISNGLIRVIDEDACGLFLRDTSIAPSGITYEDTPGGTVCTNTR
jgi:hypothetical protein